MVLGLCRTLLRNPHDAEDAAQQTFVSAYASLLAGTEPRDGGAWLATIARNECRTRAQRRMREPLPEAQTVVANADPLQQTVRAEEVESLRLAIGQLPRQQRQAFVLREFSGLSYEELAVALGVSQPAVESLLFRARRQLRVSLRSAAAALTSLPAGARDWVLQLFGAGDPGAPAGVAKLGSLPLAVKVGSLWAGTAILSATAVAVAPDHYRRAHPPAPLAIAAAGAPRAPSAPRHRRAAPVRVAVAAPVRHAVVRTAAPAPAMPNADMEQERPRHDGETPRRDGDSTVSHEAPETRDVPEARDAHAPSSDGGAVTLESADSHDSTPSSPDSASGDGSGGPSGGDSGR